MRTKLHVTRLEERDTPNGAIVLPIPNPPPGPPEPHGQGFNWAAQAIIMPTQANDHAITAPSNVQHL